MKLLVTGGAGFIGSNFVQYWMETHPDDFVVNVDALTYAGNLENLVSVSSKPNYRFIHANITDNVAIDAAMKGIDVVVHFAAESHVDRSITEPLPFVQTNVVGTQVLLDCALKNNVKRFHHISTDEVFGSLELGTAEKFNEKTPYDPRSPYSASKASSDHLVRAYYHTYGLPVTISNCSNNFGPFHFPEKLIPLAITNLLEGNKVPVYGDGKNVRDWLYVEDHCRAIDVILEKGTIGETYCIGGMSDDLDNITLVRKILACMKLDETHIEYVPDRKGHDRRYAIDWTKIHAQLGWSPKHDVDTYLSFTVDWYKSHVNWWKHIKSGEYVQYYKKQYGGVT